MPIVFFCQSCGSRFEVGDGMAGKRGHCRTCDQRMIIPLASEIASTTDRILGREEPVFGHQDRQAENGKRRSAHLKNSPGSAPRNQTRRHSQEKHRRGQSAQPG